MNVAVIDVGKTNKKIHIYDESLSLIDSRSRSFESVEQDGLLCIPSEAIEEWLLQNLGDLADRHGFDLIAITTHGATIAAVQQNGDLALPIIDYTWEPGDEFHDEFYAQFGHPNELQKTTASLPLPGLLNTAQAIHFFKTRHPDAWAKTAHLLLYPQYLAYRLTGTPSSEATYAACHGYLYDFATKGFGPVVEGLGAKGMLPEPVRLPGEILGLIDPEVAGRTGMLPTTRVMVGVHDSNSSLLPYLIKKDAEDFIVNSSGTWCVAMHPEDSVDIQPEEIGKAVFYNASVFGEPVKTSILMGGLEFDTHVTLLKDRAGLTSLPEIPQSLYQEIAAEASEFILPAVVPGTGQFPDSRARIITDEGTFALEDLQAGADLPGLAHDHARYVAVLNLSLAIQTLTALERVGLGKGVTVYTEGGFRNNPDYNSLLAALVPEAGFRLSDMAEATSFGAALLGLASLREVHPNELSGLFEIEEEAVAPMDVPALVAYAEEFHRRLSS